MAAKTSENYDAAGWTVLVEVRMEVTEKHLFGVLNRVKPAKRWLTRLSIIDSRLLTMANDNNATCHTNLSLKACLVGASISSHVLVWIKKLKHATFLKEPLPNEIGMSSRKLSSVSRVESSGYVVGIFAFRNPFLRNVPSRKGRPWSSFCPNAIASYHPCQKSSPKCLFELLIFEQSGIKQQPQD